MFGKIFGNAKAKNVMKVELALESMKLPYAKKGDTFIVYHNKYRNKENDYTTLYVIVTKDGVVFRDPRNNPITFLKESITAPEKVSSQLLNIFGLLSRKFLVTKYDIA